MELSVTPYVHRPFCVTMIGRDVRAYGNICFAEMSPSAAMIAVVELSGPNESDTKVRITDIAGRTIAELGRGAHPVWSPDSTRLTIERVSNSGQFDFGRLFDNLELFQVDEHGRFVSIVMGLPGKNPKWNQDSSGFFTKDVPQVPRCVFDRDGRQTFISIQQVRRYQYTAEWSPNGKLLLALNPRERTISVYDIHGKRTYTSTVAYEYSSVCWAYDSAHLAVVPCSHKRQAEDKWQTTVLNTQDDTSTYFDAGDHVNCLSWSPDSTRLLVVHPGCIDIREGRSLIMMTSVPKVAVMEAFVPSPSNPVWSSDSSKLAVCAGIPPTVVVYSRDGQHLTSIPLRRSMYFNLSNNFTYMFTRCEDIKVTCLVKWSDRTNYMFNNKQLRKTVFVMMMVWHTLDFDSKQQTPRLGLPRVPMELWLMVLGFLYAAPVHSS